MGPPACLRTLDRFPSERRAVAEVAITGRTALVNIVKPRYNEIALYCIPRYSCVSRSPP